MNFTSPRRNLQFSFSFKIPAETFEIPEKSYFFKGFMLIFFTWEMVVSNKKIKPELQGFYFFNFSKNVLQKIAFQKVFENCLYSIIPHTNTFTHKRVHAHTHTHTYVYICTFEIIICRFEKS